MVALGTINRYLPSDKKMTKNVNRDKGFLATYGLTRCKADAGRDLLVPSDHLNSRQDWLGDQEGSRQWEEDFSGSVSQIRETAVDGDRDDQAEARDEHGRRKYEPTLRATLVSHVL